MAAPWRRDWVATLFQGVPLLARLRHHMAPTAHLDTVAALDLPFVRRLGVRGIIWDVDGTLMPRHGEQVSPALQQMFAALHRVPDLRHVVLSNCGEHRFEELARIFPTIPLVRGYQEPERLVVRRRLGAEDVWHDIDGRPAVPSHRPALRKPSVALIQIALRELGCDDPRHALMVGDQYLTDIAPANLVGVHTVKVPTIDPDSFPRAVRLLQRAERVLYDLSV